MISIIIPTLNERDYVGKLLNSLKNQTHSNFEIIIVDSSDNNETKEAIEQFKGELRTTILKSNKKNSSFQKNIGAKKAKGNILMFLDADMIIPRKSFLEKIEKKLKDKRIKGATTNIKIIPEEALLKDHIFHKIINFKVMLLNELGIGFARGGCQIIKTAVFKRLNGFNERMVVSEDFELHRRMGLRGKVHFFKNLKIYESSRRYKKYGYIKLVFLWTINGIYGFFTKKSITKKWEAVR